MPGKLVSLNDAREAARATAKAEAWQLRLSGSTPAQIARELGVSVSTASSYLRETLKELRESSIFDAEQWKATELQRLDALIAAWLNVAQDPHHPEAARGAVILIRAVETQSRLLGLMQPNIAGVPPGGAGGGGAQTLDELAAAAAESPALLTAWERAIARAKKLQASRSVDAAPPT